MANRHTLALSRLEDLKSWIVSIGGTIEKPKGYYEVLRARHPEWKRPFIAYKKADATMHCSIDERDLWVVRRWLKEEKKKPTNYDRIKSMSIDEMTDMILEIKIAAIQHALNKAGVENRITEIEKTRSEIKQLLESEVTE